MAPEPNWPLKNAEREKQHARLALLVKEVVPNGRASFDTKGMQDSIYAMRVNDTKTGAILFTSPDRCYWTVGQIKEKNPAELKILLTEWMKAFQKQKE
jgi:hypothetical protein